MGVQAIVTLLSMAAPVVISLLALLRRESVRSVQSARVRAARSSLADQLRLLEEGRPLTLHANALAVRPCTHRGPLAFYSRVLPLQK